MPDIGHKASGIRPYARCQKQPTEVRTVRKQLPEALQRHIHYNKSHTPSNRREITDHIPPTGRFNPIVILAITSSTHEFVY
jgi:hypothetical protein